MSDVIHLSAYDLAIAAGFVVVAGLVSLAFQLRLETRLAHASVRTVVQLLLIGYILKWVFEIDRLWLIGIVMLVMIAAASRAAVQRQDRTYAGAGWWAFLTLVCCGLLTTYAVTGAVIGEGAWRSPRYVIPLLGMILGNGLNGISLCLDQLLERLHERRAVIEMELAHGATRWEAAREPVADAVRRGMIPIINSMMVVGIVSLPGMMTGQILSGTDPLEAVKYQIVVMFMIAAATSLGCIGIAMLTYRSLFNQRHQLRVERIHRRR
jgi:UDP-glucose/iron transport system permease protein